MTEPHSPFERPLECSECKRAISVYYREMNLKFSHSLAMCEQCPRLKTRLEGVEEESNFYDRSDICCGNCLTTLDSIARGGSMGCQGCYDVFSDLITSQVFVGQPSLQHRGRRPKESYCVLPSARLYTLNEALQETLSREEYEEAARIRDQINALMNKEEAIQDGE